MLAIQFQIQQKWRNGRDKKEQQGEALTNNQMLYFRERLIQSMKKGGDTNKQRSLQLCKARESDNLFFLAVRASDRAHTCHHAHEYGAPRKFHEFIGPCMFWLFGTSWAKVCICIFYSWLLGTTFSKFACLHRRSLIHMPVWLHNIHYTKKGFHSIYTTLHKFISMLLRE